MGVKFGKEEGTFGPLLRAKFHSHRCNVSPLRGKKPQNWPLSKLNTGRFALRAMLPVTNWFQEYIDLCSVSVHENVANVNITKMMTAHRNVTLNKRVRSECLKFSTSSSKIIKSWCCCRCHTVKHWRYVAVSEKFISNVLELNLTDNWLDDKGGRYDVCDMLHNYFITHVVCIAIHSHYSLELISWECSDC